MDTVGILLRAGAAGRDVGSIVDQFDRVEVPAAMAYALGLDPDQDTAGEGASLPDGRIVVLAGPGVVGTRSIDGLRAFAAAANVPVANTWGAKGVLLWDSPFHMGTCGLQARDFELLDFASYDAIVATGTAAPGTAAALGLVAALRGTPAVAVTTEPLDPTTLGVLELATELGTALAIDVWAAGGPVRRAEEHLEQLGAAVREPGVTIVDVPVDTSLTRKLVDAAGSVVAWGGLPRSA